MKPEKPEVLSEEAFPWFATGEKQRVRIVKPIQRIMGNWLLCENAKGMQWYVPFPELRPPNLHHP